LVGNQPINNRSPVRLLTHVFDFVSFALTPDIVHRTCQELAGLTQDTKRPRQPLCYEQKNIPSCHSRHLTKQPAWEKMEHRIAKKI